MAAGVYPQLPRPPESAGFLRQMLISGGWATVEPEKYDSWLGSLANMIDHHNHHNHHNNHHHHHHHLIYHHHNHNHHHHHHHHLIYHHHHHHHLIYHHYHHHHHLIYHHHHHHHLIYHHYHHHHQYIYVYILVDWDPKNIINQTFGITDWNKTIIWIHQFSRFRSIC